jgi:hypothetical protein
MRISCPSCLRAAHAPVVAHRQPGLARKWRHLEAGRPCHRVGVDAITTFQKQAVRRDLGHLGVLPQLDAEAVEGRVQVLPAALGQRHAQCPAGGQPNGAVGVGLGQLCSGLDDGQPAADHRDRRGGALTWRSLRWRRAHRGCGEIQVGVCARCRDERNDDWGCGSDTGRY